MRDIPLSGPISGNILLQLGFHLRLDVSLAFADIGATI
jgi:hypothetical protein